MPLAAQAQPASRLRPADDQHLPSVESVLVCDRASVSHGHNAERATGAKASGEVAKLSAKARGPGGLQGEAETIKPFNSGSPASPPGGPGTGEWPRDRRELKP